MKGSRGHPLRRAGVDLHVATSGSRPQRCLSNGAHCIHVWISSPAKAALDEQHTVESAKHVKMCRGHDGFLLLGNGDGDSDGTPKAS